jgi:hypothetical protein
MVDVPGPRGESVRTPASRRLMGGWSAGVGRCCAASRQSARIDRSSCRRRSGSARKSIATIFPPRTVRAPTENGSPSRVATTPTTPLTSAGWMRGRAASARRARPARRTGGPARRGSVRERARPPLSSAAIFERLDEAGAERIGRLLAAIAEAQDAPGVVLLCFCDLAKGSATAGCSPSGGRSGRASRWTSLLPSG